MLGDLGEHPGRVGTSDRLRFWGPTPAASTLALALSPRPATSPQSTDRPPRHLAAAAPSRTSALLPTPVDTLRSGLAVSTASFVPFLSSCDSDVPRLQPADATRALKPPSSHDEGASDSHDGQRWDRKVGSHVRPSRAWTVATARQG